MTTYDYTEYVLAMKKEVTTTQEIDETAAFEAAQLICGSFVFPLYETLWSNFLRMETITDHLESLYDSENHFGLVYFIVILANAVEYPLPEKFTEMSAQDAFIPILSAAIIEDWLDFDSTFETTEYEG